LRRRGYSLVEITLALALASLIILVLAVLGPRVLQSLRLSNQQSEAQRSAVVCLQRLRKEMAQAYGPSLQVLSGGSLAFASRLDLAQNPRYTPEGERLWLKWVTFEWQPSTGALTRIYDPMSVPAPRVEPLARPAISSQSSTKTIARNVTGFQVKIHPGGQLWVQVTVALERQRASLESRFQALPEITG